MKLNLKPRRAAHTGGTASESWWYENAKSIDVVIRTNDGSVGTCRIHRRYLADWLKRTEVK